MQPTPVKMNYFMQHMDSDSLPTLATRYLSTEMAGRSHHTFDARRRDLGKFFASYNRLNGHLSAQSLQPRDVKLFVGELHSKGFAGNTINRTIGSIRAFGSWLVENNHIHSHPCKGIRDLKVELGPPKAPRDHDYHRLVKTAQVLADAERTSLSQNLRDLVIIETLNASGLRVSELLNLRLSQFQGKRFHRVLCKGGKIRDVSIKTSICDLLNDYITNHRTPGADFLFTSKTGNQLDRISLWKALKKVARLTSASFPSEAPVELTPHRLRHRHAYQCRSVKDPVFAAARLGHSGLSYIHRYSQETQQEERDLIESIE